MPQDSAFGDNLFNARCLGWELAFAWLPHRCHLTRRWIWFEYAYVGTAMHRADTMFFYEHRWHHKYEHLIWALKR
jgi:hypothetical protein